MYKSETAFRPQRWLALVSVVLTLSSCFNQDKTPPRVTITNPIYEGSDFAFGDVFFAQFIAEDDREDGGIWYVELRSGNGINVLTSQAGFWQGKSSDTLTVPFLLDAPQWPSSDMTLAVIADDAAGNRAADFRDFNYSGAADVPQKAAVLTQETDGTSRLIIRPSPTEPATVFDGLALSHTLAIDQEVIAIGHVGDASVTLIEATSGNPVGFWNDALAWGVEPFIRRVHPLKPQPGFLVIHSSGMVALSPSGQLLFERFSEAPWSPVDAVFSGNQVVLWERNIGAEMDRLRSWNYTTGAAGPIISLPFNLYGLGSVNSHESTAPGDLFLISEQQGLTLCEPMTGLLNDLCALIGSGEVVENNKTIWGDPNGFAMFVRGGNVCKQAIGDVSSGSQWPMNTTVHSMRQGPESIVWLTPNSEGTENTIWQWPYNSSTPNILWEGLPTNTVDIAF